VNAASPVVRDREVDHRGAFDVERLQFLEGERDELAATVFVSFDDLAFVDLLAGSGIMRPESSNPSSSSEESTANAALDR
jgi:hypothetical protein